MDPMGYRPSNHRVEVLRLLRQLPDGTIFRRNRLSDRAFEAPTAMRS